MTLEQGERKHEVAQGRPRSQIRRKGVSEVSWLTGWYLISSRDEYFTGHKAEALQQLHVSLRVCFCLGVCVCLCERVCMILFMFCWWEFFTLFSLFRKRWLSVYVCRWIIYIDVELEKNVTVPGKGVEWKEAGIWQTESFKTWAAESQSTAHWTAFLSHCRYWACAPRHVFR